MFHHPTLDKLKTLKFSGMSHALEKQLQCSDITELSFEERLGCWSTEKSSNVTTAD